MYDSVKPDVVFWRSATLFMKSLIRSCPCRRWASSLQMHRMWSVSSTVATEINVRFMKCLRADDSLNSSKYLISELWQEKDHVLMSLLARIVSCTDNQLRFYRHVHILSLGFVVLPERRIGIVLFFFFWYGVRLFRTTVCTRRDLRQHYFLICQRN